MMETWRLQTKLDNVDIMLLQSEFCREFKTSPLSLQASDVALGFLIYYSCSCSSHESSEIRNINSQEDWPMIWCMGSHATMMHTHPRSQKSTLIKTPPSTLI